MFVFLDISTDYVSTDTELLLSMKLCRLRSSPAEVNTSPFSWVIFVPMLILSSETNSYEGTVSGTDDGISNPLMPKN
jgi:hypothetical protein